MAYYAPFGNFQNEVIDPDELSQEWQEAKRIATSMTHWQMCTENTGNRFDFRAIENGASAIVHTAGGDGYCGHGFQHSTIGDYYHCDAPGLWPNWYRKRDGAWLVPYLKGYQEVYDGGCAVSWKSEYPELVMFSMSWRTYRLSGSGWGYTTGDSDVPDSHITSGGVRTISEYFGEKCRPRIKLAINLDGENLAGTGPGMNTPTDKYNLLRGQGMFYKTEKSTSTFVTPVAAGDHRASAVAGQFAAQYQDKENVRRVNEMDYFQGDRDDLSVEFGVAVPQCRLTVIRFPRGTMLGG